MFALVKRDFMAIPYYVYIVFMLFPIILLFIGLNVLFTAVVIAVGFWATIYGVERHRKAEQFFVSLPVSRLELISARYASTFIVLGMMIGYSYLLSHGLLYIDSSIIVPDGVTTYIMICLAVLLVSIVLPNAYLFRSYQLPLYTVSIQFFIYLIVANSLYSTYSLNENISYDTGDESVLFTFVSRPWATELVRFIEYYLPSYSLVWLTLITIIVFAGSFSLSYFAYRRQNVG